MRSSGPRRHAPLLLLLAAAAMGGCTPSKVNIELRKENQSLSEQIDTLKTRRDADMREIAALHRDRPTIPTLPPERLQKLVTTHGLEFLRLTGGVQLQSNHDYDDGISVYIVPTDGSAEPIKAAGAFTVDVFDLADRQEPLVGHWQFSRQEAAVAWNGHILDYNYVLTCPWQRVIPKHRQLTIKVTFLDELTQLTFQAQKVINVRPPPQPSTAPTTQPR